jgi:hypothetical protein
MVGICRGGSLAAAYAGRRAARHCAPEREALSVTYITNLTYFSRIGPGLAAADGDAESLGRFLDVLEVQCDQLGAAEGARKANEQQGSVPNGRKPRPREWCHSYYALGGGGHLLAGRSTEGAPDTADGGPHTLIVGRQGQAGQLVRVTDRSNAAAYGGRPDLALGFMGQESRHAFS